MLCKSTADLNNIKHSFSSHVRFKFFDGFHGRLV